jgi:nucleotide-binding universal stress UspA family protein
VEVTTAWQYPSGAAPITIDASTLEREALELTHRVAADAFPEEAPAGLTFSAVMGPTIRVLEEASRRAALLVIGSRGYGSVRGALLGSVSRVLAASSHCPILIYHDADGGTEPA